MIIFDPKVQKSQFKTNLNMQNFIVMLTFSILNLFASFAQKSVWHFDVA